LDLSLEKAMELYQLGISLIGQGASRRRARRYLESASQCNDKSICALSKIALGLSYHQETEYSKALTYLKEAIVLDPWSMETVFAMKLLAEIYRFLGQRHERFEMDDRRMTVLKKIALGGGEQDERLFALSELIKEYEGRDQVEEAAKYQKEYTLCLQASGKPSF
jgi:tetratricopeptide (TPR) repeat protein